MNNGDIKVKKKKRALCDFINSQDYGEGTFEII